MIKNATKRILVLFGVAAIILSGLADLFGGAEAADSSGAYVIVNDRTCGEIISAHKTIKLTDQKMTGNDHAWILMGWVSGYATAANNFKRGKQDHFSGMTPNDMISWVATWCQANPDGSIELAMEALVKKRRK